jgi:hypothetical protein
MRGGLFLAICAGILAATVSTASAVTLYSTSFNNPPFDPASGFWAGVDGWAATDPSNGSAGVMPGGGAVYLGNTAPANMYSAAERLFGFDAVSLGVPIVKIRTRLMIADSTNSHRDAFGLTIFNRSGSFVCGLVFDNIEKAIYYDDGAQGTFLNLFFVNGVPLEASLILNLSTNRASLSFYDEAGKEYPAFTNVTLNQTGAALDFGALDYQWLLNETTAGDNFMVVDSLSVEVQKNPALVIAKGTRQRTKADSYILRGGQAAEDDVRIEWKSKTQWRWTPVRGAATNWTIRLRRLTKGRNAVQIRMLDALGRTIDQQNVNILRK